MDIKDVKFIRALWGDFKHFINEIPRKPMYNELVYVWGRDNFDFLKGLGYDTTLISEENEHHIGVDKFNHKVECFLYASKQFDKFIFLDWDVKQVKKFNELIIKDVPFLSPVYAYPKEFYQLDYEPSNMWIKNQIELMKKYTWDMEDILVLPNAGFFYCGDNTIPTEMMKIIKKNNLTTLVEEFALFILSDCDLETYILNYEPTHINGRVSEDEFILNNIRTNCSKKINDYTSSIIKKDIYFKHL